MPENNKDPNTNNNRTCPTQKTPPPNGLRGGAHLQKLQRRGRDHGTFPNKMPFVRSTKAPNLWEVRIEDRRAEEGTFIKPTEIRRTNKETTPTMITEQTTELDLLVLNNLHRHI